jgi:hypothetical protein
MPAAPTLDKTTQFAIDFFAAQCGHFTNQCEDPLYPHFTLSSVTPVTNCRVALAFDVSFTPFPPALPKHLSVVPHDTRHDDVMEPTYSQTHSWECFVPEKFEYPDILQALASDTTSKRTFLVSMVENRALRNVSMDCIHEAVHAFELVELARLLPLSHANQRHIKPL